MDDLTITACEEAFNHPMGPFYLNGGGFNGASDLVKDLTINTLLGSPRPTISSQSSRSRLRQRRRKQMPAPSDPTIHYYPIAP